MTSTVTVIGYQTLVREEAVAWVDQSPKDKDTTRNC